MMSSYMNKPEETKMASRYSEAQNRATKKYQNKVYDNIRLRLPKGFREEHLKTVIDASGMSMNDYILLAVYEKSQRDGFDIPNPKTWRASQE